VRPLRNWKGRCVSRAELLGRDGLHRADKRIGDIHYLNSGDWVESLTAIVEHWDGRFELVDFASFVRRFPLPAPDAIEPGAELAEV
jgi:hypothetical protein